MLDRLAGRGVASKAASAAVSATMAASLRKINSGDLHVSKPSWWLESRFHFAFSDWWTGKQNFGALRVLNDDLVQGKAGFGKHPHRDAEIFSYVVSGQLSHQDSMGNKESLARGAVQYLSAGTGIFHSEMNDHEEVCRFLQVWITPDKNGHTPQYGSETFEKEARHNKLLVLLAGTKRIPNWPGIQHGKDIVLHQDTTVFVSENDPGVEHAITFGPKRQGYLVCIEGSMDVSTEGTASVALEPREAVEIVADGQQELPVALKAGQQGGHFMLIELAKA